jgi:hypothetical protein
MSISFEKPSVNKIVQTGDSIRVRLNGALFYCSLFINMNRLFAFIIGAIVLVVAGFYSLYEILKGNNNGSKSKNKFSK